MHPEPRYLLPNSVHEIDGIGPTVALGQERGKLLVVTLGIDEVVNRHLLLVSLWGSPDGAEFGDSPLTIFRPRQYTGMHSTLLNLAGRSDLNFLRVQWQIERHRKSNHEPMFHFRVFFQQSGARLGSAVSMRSFTQAMGAPKWSQSRGHAA